MVADKLEQNLRNHLANTRVNLFSDKAGVVGYQRPGSARRPPPPPPPSRALSPSSFLRFPTGR